MDIWSNHNNKPGDGETLATTYRERKKIIRKTQFNFHHLIINQMQVKCKTEDGGDTQFCEKTSSVLDYHKQIVEVPVN